MTRTRTENYRFTVKMENGQPVGDDLNRVNELREHMKGTGWYVKLQGRGHRQGVYRYNQSLPLKYATTADVYVYYRR